MNERDVITAFKAKFGVEQASGFVISDETITGFHLYNKEKKRIEKRLEVPISSLARESALVGSSAKVVNL